MSKPRKARYRKKSRVKPILLALTGIAILMIVTAIILFMKPSTSVQQGVPLYEGTSITAYVNSTAIKNFTKDLLTHINCSSSSCIVMFGFKGCSYCLAMYSFFTGNPKYRDIYTVLWLYENQVANELFLKLSNIEMSSGVSPWVAGSVPQTLIIKDGEVRAIVVGEVRDQVFWDDILK